MAALDSERGSLAKYSDEFDFDVVELDSFSPASYIEGIVAASEAGYGILIIDSLSHAWAGKDGAIELADRAARKSSSGNKFTSWKEVTPLFNRMMDSILTSKMHMICTYRTKTEYVMEEDERGKKAPKKKGLAFVTKDGVEYEFDVVGEFPTVDNSLVITKSRCKQLHGELFDRPGDDLTKILAKWLSEGSPAEAKPSTEVAAEELIESVQSQVDQSVSVAVKIAQGTARIQALSPYEQLEEYVRSASSLNALEDLKDRLRALTKEEQQRVLPIYTASKKRLMAEVPTG